MRPGEGQNRSVGRDERRAVEKALRVVGDVRSILDVAAGNGRWLPTLSARKARRIVAFDLSRETLASSRSGGPASEAAQRVGLVCGEAGALPFSSQSFELVFCVRLMPYVRRSGRLRALREMRRVTGRWVILEYAHVEGLGFFWQRTRRWLGLEARFPRNHLTSAEIENELRLVGLGVRGFARVGGMFSRSWIVLAEAPSPDWMQA